MNTDQKHHLRALQQCITSPLSQISTSQLEVAIASGKYLTSRTVFPLVQGAFPKDPLTVPKILLTLFSRLYSQDSTDIAARVLNCLEELTQGTEVFQDTISPQHFRDWRGLTAASIMCRFLTFDQERKQRSKPADNFKLWAEELRGTLRRLGECMAHERLPVTEVLLKGFSARFQSVSLEGLSQKLSNDRSSATLCLVCELAQTIDALFPATEFSEKAILTILSQGVGTLREVVRVALTDRSSKIVQILTKDNQEFTPSDSELKIAFELLEVRQMHSICFTVQVLNRFAPRFRILELKQLDSLTILLLKLFGPCKSLDTLVQHSSSSVQDLRCFLCQLSEPSTISSQFVLSEALQSIHRGSFSDCFVRTKKFLDPFVHHQRDLSSIDVLGVPIALTLAALSEFKTGFVHRAKRTLELAWYYSVQSQQMGPPYSSLVLAAWAKIHLGKEVRLLRSLVDTPPSVLRSKFKPKCEWNLGFTMRSDERPMEAVKDSKFLTAFTSQEIQVSFAPSINPLLHMASSALGQCSNELFEARIAVTHPDFKSRVVQPNFHSTTSESYWVPPPHVALLTLSKCKDHFIVSKKTSSSCLNFSLPLQVDRENPLQIFLSSLDRILQKDAALCYQGYHIKKDDTQFLTEDDKKECATRWWSERKNLDAELGEAFKGLDYSLFSHWRALLVGHPLDASLRQQLEQTADETVLSLAKLVPNYLFVDEEIQRMKSLLSETLLGLPYLNQDVQEALERCPQGAIPDGEEECLTARTLSSIVEENTKRFWEPELLKAVQVAIFQILPQLVQDQIILDDEDEEIVAQIEILAERCFEKTISLFDAACLASAQPTCLLSLERQHTFLVLHPSVQAIPWEGLPLLRNLYVSRVPSELFVQKELSRTSIHSIDIEKLRYAINPSTDQALVKSERLFGKLLDRGPSNWKGWYGSQGDKFTPKEFLCGGNDVYLFAGHNDGREVVSGKALDSLEPTEISVRLVFLMGCSSGKLHFEQHDAAQVTKTAVFAQGEGAALQYLSAGIPCVVSCLWTVSNLELDKLTLGLLRHVLPKVSKIQDVERVSTRRIPLSEALNHGKMKCKFSNLTAASVVTYGVPPDITPSIRNL